MGKLDKKVAELEQRGAVTTPADESAAAVERISSKPSHISADVWKKIQANGEKAVELLHEILHSMEFVRMKPGDKEKFLRLAMERAYGPAAKQFAESAELGKARAKIIDGTAHVLEHLAARALLPEYQGVPPRGGEVEEAEVIESPPNGEDD